MKPAREGRKSLGNLHPKHKLPSSLHKILLACATNSLLRLRSSTPVDISMMNRMISTPLIITSRRGAAASLSSRRLPTTTSTTAINSWSSSSSSPSLSHSYGLPFKRHCVSSSTPASSSSAAAVTASFNEDDDGSNTSNNNNNDDITSSRYSIQGTFREGRASYLDASATTPLDPRVLDKMMPYMVSE